MADPVTFKVEGLSDLKQALEALSEETQKKITRAMTSAAAKAVQKRAIEHAPDADEPHKIEGVVVQPGNLKRNIIQKRNTKTRLTSEHYVTVRGGEKGNYAARYGSLVEHGTVKMPPRSYLRRSFLEQVTDLPRQMAEVGKKKITTAVRRLARSAKKAKG